MNWLRLMNKNHQSKSMKLKKIKKKIKMLQVLRMMKSLIFIKQWNKLILI